jgi:hypothetical protein
MRNALRAPTANVQNAIATTARTATDPSANLHPARLASGAVATDVRNEPMFSAAVYMPMAVPWRAGAKSRRMISGTAMLPTVIAKPISTVPDTTSTGPPAERTKTPASTPRIVSVTANSAPNFLAANDAKGAAREKHRTGILVSSPSRTGEKFSSACIRSTTGATATNGPRRLSASRPMHASRIQLLGIRARIRPLTG